MWKAGSPVPPGETEGPINPDKPECARVRMAAVRTPFKGLDKPPESH